MTDKPTVTLVGEDVPADPMVIGRMLEPIGLAVGPTIPVREWRDLYAALDCAAVAAIHPFYTATLPRVHVRRPQPCRLRPDRARRHGRLARRHRPDCNISQERIDQTRNAMRGAISAGLAANRINGRITLSWL